MMKKTILIILCLWLQAASAEDKKLAEFRLLSDKKVSEMGAKAYSEQLEKITISNNEALIAKVNCIGVHLTKYAPKAPEGTNWNFIVVEDSTPNVYSFPSGNVVVNTGLISALSDDEMLAAAVANPISAVLLKEVNRRISYDYLTSQYSKMSPEEKSAATQNFRHKFKLETDNTAYDLLKKSGIAPINMLKTIKLLQSLKVKEDDFDKVRVQNIEGLLATEVSSSNESNSSQLICP